MSNNELCKTDIPKMLEIADVVHEAKSQKSFFFKQSIDCKPGQFVMVWLPGLDEKPMAVSYWKKNEFAFTSQAIGKFTNKLDTLKKGGKLGIRGPYGNSFSNKNNACVVGGGVGMASVSTLIDVLKNPIIINGARDKEHLIYIKRYRNKNMIITTDDGSFGRKGFTTEVLEEVLSQNKTHENQSPKNAKHFGNLKTQGFQVFSGLRKSSEMRVSSRTRSQLTGFSREIKIVYTCGPEIMMKKIFEICQKHKVECEASLERYMKCSFGICGACMIDDKIVCIDGPIFNSSQLNKLSEFGKFARIKTGRKVTLKEYHSIH